MAAPAIFASWLPRIVQALSVSADLGIRAATLAKDFPWRKVFAWAFVAGITYYFFGLLWYGFLAVGRAIAFVANSGNFGAAGSPESGILGTSLNLSAFWTFLASPIPPTFRHLMWWCGVDWLLFVAFNMLHMRVIGFVVDGLLGPMSKAIREVFKAL